MGLLLSGELPTRLPLLRDGAIVPPVCVCVCVCGWVWVGVRVYTSSKTQIFEPIQPTNQGGNNNLNTKNSHSISKQTPYKVTKLMAEIARLTILYSYNNRLIWKQIEPII